MSIIIDFITDLGLEIVKERISDIVTLNIVKGRIEEFLKQQLSLNYNITREEEVDFGGLAEYIRCNLLDDVKKRCFGKKEERRMARKRIMENAVSYASAHTIISAKRTMKIVGDCVDILAEYYRSKVNRELLFVAGEKQDCLVEENEETRALITEERKHLEDVILENTALSVDHSIRKIESGKIYEVENKIGTFMNAISSEHTLFPDYGFRMTKDNKLTSVALNDEAKIKYPEKFKITASSVKLGDKLVHDSGKNIFDQAYRHQLPIYIEVENAQKYLGDFLDPIQTEAEEMIGSQAIMNTNQLTVKQWEEQEALHRFQLISPLLNEDLDDAKKIQLRKQIAEENEITIRSLYRYEKAYREGHFSGLKPATRKKHRSQKLPENFEFLVEEAIQLRKEVPERSVAQIILILEMEGHVAPGVLKRSTLERHLYKRGFGREHMKMYRDARESSSKRFCKPHRMMLIQGDIKYGPKLPIGKNGAKIQTYLSSAIDDHSRYILASRFYDNQEETIVEDTFHQAIIRHGAFDACYSCDYGWRRGGAK